tara:strand:- start:1200 stop:1451 length:252 start_codon:yes stop_codon:yes gene_type:complete
MQKLINVIALLSGLTSLAVIGGGVYVVMNQDAWREAAKERLTELVAGAITDELPGMMDGLMPLETGPSVPFGEVGPSSGVRLP